LRDDISRPHGDASTQTAAERAHGELRRRILDGRLPPGHRLKEAELAAELGLSRTPVRDALSRLTVEGLLDFRANAGATVAVWAERQIELMFRIRSLLEPLAAEVAAPQITDAEVEEMRRLCAVMEEAARRETPADLNRLIIEATHSDQLIKLATLALDTPLSLRIFSRYTTAEIARSMRHHREIVDALSHRDPAWAASAMRTHILASIGVARGSKIASD
jgi:DNA-binding GntR family transcriptional regulator